MSGRGGRCGAQRIPPFPDLDRYQGAFRGIGLGGPLPPALTRSRQECPRTRSTRRRPPLPNPGIVRPTVRPPAFVPDALYCKSGQAFIVCPDGDTTPTEDDRRGRQGAPAGDLCGDVCVAGTPCTSPTVTSFFPTRNASCRFSCSGPPRSRASLSFIAPALSQSDSTAS